MQGICRSEMCKFVDFIEKTAFLGLIWINISKFVLSLHGEIVASWENYALIYRLAHPKGASYDRKSDVTKIIPLEIRILTNIIDFGYEF